MSHTRIRFTVAYDGTSYHGWQVQPGLPTVQGKLEEVLSTIEGGHVHVMGSGRTDAGVHALGQVAAADIANPIPSENLRRAANRLLPPDIRILVAADVPANFHPRFDAVAKTYQYRVARSEVCSPFERRYVHHYPYPLDTAAMVEAALCFAGTHDFSAFAASDDRDELGLSKVRTIFSSVLEDRDDHLLYAVRGTGFLKHMVRNIVGTLFEVGKGNLKREGIRAFLSPGHPSKAGPRAPASGLFLLNVEYSSD
jgi:tRNA pseudouridine38-40 synthase